MSPDEGWILDMLVAARTVKQFAGGADYQRFQEDSILQNAIMRQIQIIGEAARNVPDAFRAAHPEIPWSQIVGMRNRLVHHYFRILPERVWEVVERDIDILISQLEPLVPRPPGDEEGPIEPGAQG